MYICSLKRGSTSKHGAGTLLGTRYVENDSTSREFKVEQERKREQAAWTAAEAAAKAEAKAQRDSDREEAIAAVRELIGENCWALWQTAVDTIVQHTSASAAYVANVSHPEEPEPAIEEAEAEGAPPEEADFALFDEPEPVPEEDKPAEEAPAEPAEPPAEGAPAEGEAAAAAKTFDYGPKFLEFVVTSEETQLAPGLGTLRRPAPPAEGEEEKPQAPLPLPFTLLDQNLRQLYYPDAMLAPNLGFPDNFPRPGAYLAHSVITEDKEIKALVCCDTIMPAGNGLAMTEEDRAFIQGVVDAVEGSMKAAQARFDEAVAASTNKERRRELQASMAALAEEINSTAPPEPEPIPEDQIPPVPEPEAPAADAPAEGEAAAPADAEPAAADGEGDQEEGDAAEGGECLPVALAPAALH